MKTTMFIEIQARFTKSFLKKMTYDPSMLRFSEAMKNEVMRITCTLTDAQAHFVR